MKFMKLLGLMLLVPALVYAGIPTAPELRQNIKAEIRIVVDDKEAVILPAKKPELSLRSNFFEEFWRLLFNANQPIVPVGSFKFQTAIDPNDLPGGGFYLCNTKDDDEQFYFNLSATNSPRKEFVLFKPSEIISIKNPEGSFTYTLPAPIKPGRYAFYFADSQYAWPFVVK